MRMDIDVKTYYYQCCKCGHEQVEFNNAICEECRDFPITRNTVTDDSWSLKELSDISVSALTLDISDLIARAKKEEVEEHCPLCIEEG